MIELLVSNMVSSGGSCTLDPPGTLVEELESYPPVASARLALESTGLLEALVPALPAEVLYQRERVTVLAPTDAAFSTFFLASGQQDADALDEVMRHHLIEGELEVHELVRDAPHWTMAGKPIRFVEDPDGTIRIDGTNARIVEAEHWALDGNIYVIDEVLPVPETPPSTMETVAVSSASAEEIGGVQLDHETWDGKLVGYPKFNVYTPPGYYADLPAGYPVVYLLHDVGGDHLSLFGGPTMGQTPTTGLHQVVETLVNSANIPPMILVSINGLSQGYGSYFVGESSETSSPTFGAFGSYVAEIVTQVESTYNTATAPDSSENRALLGVGMGGFGAIHLASSHPVFSAVVVHSGLLSVADLLESDAVVASTYPDGEVDGSLWSEVMYAWKEAYGTELLDGRLTELVGPGQPAISRMVSMATAFSPMEAFFLEFDQAGTTTAGAAAGRVTDIDGDATNNHDYPVVAVDTNLTAEVIDDQYIGYRLPWSSDGTLDEAVWAQWAAYEPLAALEGAAEALQDADTDFYLDCGTENERGLVDQIEGFVQSASAAVGDEQMNLEIYQGDHAGQVYTERFYASMLWLGGILVEEAAAP